MLLNALQARFCSEEIFKAMGTHSIESVDEGFLLIIPCQKSTGCICMTFFLSHALYLLQTSLEPFLRRPQIQLVRPQARLLLT